MLFLEKSTFSECLYGFIPGILQKDSNWRAKRILSPAESTPSGGRKHWSRREKRADAACKSISFRRHFACFWLVWEQGKNGKQVVLRGPKQSFCGLTEQKPCNHKASLSVRLSFLLYACKVWNAADDCQKSLLFQLLLCRSSKLSYFCRKKRKSPWKK